MLRCAVLLTLSVLALTACGGGGDSEGAPPITPLPDLPSGEMPMTPDDIDVSITPIGKSQAATANPNSDSLTLATIAENSPWAVTIIASAPGDEKLVLALEDDGNGDAAFFAFDEETGELSLRSPQDFERPKDANEDSRFELLLTAPAYPELDDGLSFTIDIGDQPEIFERGDAVLILGATDYGGLGRNAINLGDIDEDGRPDLILAAPGQHTRDLSPTPAPPESNQGELFVLSGAAMSKMETHSVRDSLPAGVWKLDGSDQDRWLGYSMSTIGDLDEDGLNDVAIARNENEIVILSGAILAEQMRAGGVDKLDDLAFGTLTLQGDFFVDPHAITAVGDLNQDAVPDLAICLRDEPLSRPGSSKLVTALSGAALAEIMTSQSETPLHSLISTGRAGHYGVYSVAPYCSRMSALGDVNADGLVDIGFASPVYGSSAAWVISGAFLSEWMQHGATYDSPSPFVYAPPYIEFDDPLISGNPLDRVTVPLGDVTGDEIDDFALSWKTYQGAEHSGFIIKGSPSLLNNPNPLTVRDYSARGLVASGRAIALQGPGGNNRVTSIFSILPPDEALHEALVLVRSGQNRVLSFGADDVPGAGSSELILPVGATGDLRVPEGYVSNFSEMLSIGDLNRDGYGDLAIGYAIANPAHSSYRPEDGGVVWLVSGKALLEYRARGETFNPDHVQPLPPNSRD